MAHALPISTSDVPMEIVMPRSQAPDEESDLGLAESLTRQTEQRRSQEGEFRGRGDPMDAGPSRGEWSSNKQGLPAAHASTPQTHMQTQTRIFFPSSPRHTSSPPSPATSSSTTPRHTTMRSTYSKQGQDYSLQPPASRQTSSQQGQDHYRSYGQQGASGSPYSHPRHPLFMLPVRSYCECPISSPLRANELAHLSHDNPCPPPSVLASVQWAWAFILTSSVGRTNSTTK